MQRIYDAALRASNGSDPGEAQEGAQAALAEAAAIMREYSGRRPGNRPAELAEMQPAWLRACADILDGWAQASPNGPTTPATPEQLEEISKRTAERIEAVTLPEREPGAAMADNPAPEPPAGPLLGQVRQTASEFSDPGEVSDDEPVPIAAWPADVIDEQFSDPAPTVDDGDQREPPPF